MQPSEWGMERLKTATSAARGEKEKLRLEEKPPCKKWINGDGTLLYTEQVVEYLRAFPEYRGMTPDMLIEAVGLGEVVGAGGTTFQRIA